MENMTNSLPHLLVIDDEQRVLDLLKLQLEGEGYRVSQVNSGENALTFLENSERVSDPVHAVILDIMMSPMNGYEVLRRIRNSNTITDTQVLVLTCLSSEEDHENALKAGADDFISKPWNLRDLLSRIQLLLDRKVSTQSLNTLSKKMQALRISSRALLGIHDLDEILKIILRELRNVLNYTSSSIFLIENNILHLVANEGFQGASQVFTFEDLHKLEHVKYVIDSKETLIINDTFYDARWVHFPDSDYISSWMGTPLIFKDRVIGILNVDMDLVNYFSHEDAELAIDFASQAALAIENAQNRRHLERQSSLTKALVKASNQLASTVEIEMQLQAVWDFVSDQMHAPMFYIGFCDMLQNELAIKMLYDMGERKNEVRLPLGEASIHSLSTYVVTTGIPVRWLTYEERAETINRLRISPNIIGSTCASCLVQPLKSDGQIIGVIAIQSDRPYVWDDVDIDIFSALADMVAATASTSQTIKDIQTDQQRLVSAFDATSELRTSLDADQLLSTIVDRLQQTLNCAQVNVVLVDERRKPIHHAITGYAYDMDSPTVMRPDGISMRVLSTGVPKFMDILAKHEKEIHPELLKRGAKSSACIPLPLDDQFIGVLWAHFDVPHHFTEHEQEMLRIYAKQVAKTYEGIRLLKELERLRQTADSLASASPSTNIFETVARIAKEEFRAISVAVWAYDHEQQEFILENTAASGIDAAVWERFKMAEPQKDKGGTAFTVMERGWLPIQDINSFEAREVIGQSTHELLSSIGVKSFLGVTLRDDQEIFGVLYINYAEEREFNSFEQKSIQAFASQAGMAAKKAKLFDQLEKAKQTAHIVAEHTALGDLRKTLNSIVKGTKNVIHCDTVTLYTYNEKDETFDFPPEMEGVIFTEKVVELDHGKDSVPYRIVARNDLYLSVNADEDPLIRSEFTRRENIKSFAGVPLMANNTKVGVMCLSFRHRHRFTSSDITIIKLLAMQAAVAIQNAYSYKKEREKTEILQALNAASQAVSGLLNETEILNMLAKQASKLTGIHGEASASCVGMIEGENKLYFKTSYPEDYFGKLHLENVSINLGFDDRVGICGRAIHQRKSQLVMDVEKDMDYLALDVRTGSELAVPILIGDIPIGVINVEHPKKFVFSDEDCWALEMLASHASIAIEKARTFEQLKAAQLNVSSLTNIVWTGMLAQAWQHSIRNHSVIISDNVKLIRDDLDRGYPLEGVIDKLSQIETVISEIQAIPMPPLSTEDGVESILVHQLILDRLKQYKQKNGRFAKITYNAEIQTDLSTSIRASREWVRRLLDILIHNAVNAMVDSETKVLTVRSEVETNGIRILIMDTGHGISAELRPKLLEMPIPKAKGEKGSGIGLYLGKEIAKTYGGFLEIGPSSSSGTTISVWFPAEN